MQAANILNFRRSFGRTNRSYLLHNAPKIFQDIRNRKKETTSLASKMEKAPCLYIDQLDEVDREKNSHWRRA